MTEQFHIVLSHWSDQCQPANDCGVTDLLKQLVVPQSLWQPLLITIGPSIVNTPPSVWSYAVPPLRHRCWFGSAAALGWATSHGCLRYLTAEECEEFLEALLVRAELIEVLEELKICRDPKNDKSLNLASGDAANYLMTGDEDLLILQTYHGAHILNARDFLELLT